MPEHGALLHITRREGQRLRRARPERGRADAVARRFQALSDPTRLALALSLEDDRELCVCDLSWIVERSQNLVSHHMRTLRNDGLVSARREGKMTMYSLTSFGETLVAAARAQVAAEGKRA